MEGINSIKIVDELIDTFFEAGKLSLKIRDKELIKKTKSDNTPVTNGDIEVNNILTKKISELTPDIPIVSEESSKNKENNKLKTFWLIDPIDGTYDYINGKDEFTLNAALIINNKTSVGVVYAPAKDRMFYTYGQNSSFEINNGNKNELKCKKISKINEIKALSYSNDLKTEIIKIHKKYNVTNFTKMKSSLKFCVVATGEYDLYAAEPRACEWDIAAGHAILIGAGGEVTDFDGNEILYGKKDFKNPSLILKRSSKL
tara:strand:- start:2746 stop:3519 length:774 start_codon:yes stop_codon:yes gene_type:complete